MYHLFRNSRYYFNHCKCTIVGSHASKSVRCVSYQELYNSSPVKLSYAKIDGEDTDPDPSPAPLFILHGLFGAKQNWRTIGKRLNEKTGRQVISLDARNHGNSAHSDKMNYFVQTLDAKTLIKELHLKKTVLIGHSMGGKVAMTLALSFPELVDKLVIVDISPSSSRSDSEIQGYLQTKLQMDLSQIRNKNDAENMMKSGVESKLIRQFFLSNLVQLPEGGFKWRVNLEAIDKNIQEIMSFPSKFPHEQFNGEVLFIGGGNSNHIQKNDHGKIYKLFPNAEITYIPDCGHWVHAQKPMELIQLILDFL